MHRIRGQNLFLFILYFLLSFIKHQNAAGVLSPGLRQLCLAVLPAAGTRGQGQILRAVVMGRWEIWSSSRSPLLSHRRSCPHSRHSCGDVGSCLGIPHPLGGKGNHRHRLCWKMAPSAPAQPACSHVLPPCRTGSHGKILGLIYNGGMKLLIPFPSSLHPMSTGLVWIIFVWLEILKLKKNNKTLCS